MAPDSPDSRMARMEERIGANQRQIEIFGALPLAVERVQWGLDELAGDFKQFKADQDKRFERHEQENLKNLERLARSFENQVIACKGSVDEVAKVQREAAQAFTAWQKAEEERRLAAHKEIREERSQSDTSRRAMWGLLGAAAIGGVFAFLVQLLQVFSG